MLRGAQRMSSDMRTSAPYLARTYSTADGRIWSFWSMAPGATDSHWVTDGTTFALADGNGLAVGDRSRIAAARTLAELDQEATLRQVNRTSTLRMADDVFGSGSGGVACAGLVVPASKKPTATQRSVAMARCALKGPKLTEDQCRELGRRQLATGHAA